MRDAKQHRLFFALWPDDATRQNIVNEFNRCPQAGMAGKIMRPENIHMTLHFIGNVADQTLNCMDNAAKTVQARKFNLQIDHYGYFYRPKVFWMGIKEVPGPLKKLHEQLACALHPCGYQSDKRVFSPHITMKRKISHHGVLDKFPAIDWSISDFVLVESIPVANGVNYEVIRTYPLK